jgi:hypothetical protein
MMKEGNSSKNWFQLANYRRILDAWVRQKLSSYEADSQDSIRCVKNDPIQCEIYCVGDKSHSTQSKEESNKVQTDKKISDQKSKKISN